MDKRQIVIIDDDTITLELLKHMIEDLNSSEIQGFSSSMDGWEHLKALPVQELSLVVCDWEMPELNGLQLLQAFRQRFPTTPFLMVTGNATRDTVLAAKKMGASGFIAKPFTTEELTSKVRLAMGFID